MAQRKRRGMQSIYILQGLVYALYHLICTLIERSSLCMHVTVFSNLDLLAKVFLAWIQVRNIATVEKVNNLEKARVYYEKKLMKKVFEAWLFLRVSRTTGKSE